MANILSLFDGISCAQIAAERAGIVCSRYYASEIHTNSIKVTQLNYPDTIQLGDINNWKEWDIDWSSIDLLIGGFPCQSFSFAGKGKAFNDPRGQLFFRYVEILNHLKAMNPKIKFLAENVKMKREYLDFITDQLDIASLVFINSSLVSAQNRQRYYWFNWDAPMPENKGIVLSDIIEDGFIDRDKTYCIDANYWKGGNLERCFEKRTRLTVFCGAMRGRYVVDGKRQDGKMKTAGLTKQRIEVRYDGKTNALTTVQKDNWVVYDADGQKYYDPSELTFRKLTPLECERLQCVPDHYTVGISNTERYKALGNGFTVDVIAHLLKYSGLSSSTDVE